MLRRRFLRTVLASIAAMFVPKKVKAEQELRTVEPMDPVFMKLLCDHSKTVPFLPTLEWLREHNPDIVGVVISMHETGGDPHDTFMRGVGSSTGRTWTGYIHRKLYPLQTYDTYIMAQLFWKDGTWSVVDQLRLTRNGAYSYANKHEWPDWLRRF